MDVSRKVTFIAAFSFLSLLGGKVIAQYSGSDAYGVLDHGKPTFEQEMNNAAADHLDDAADWLDKWGQPNVSTRKRCTYITKALSNLQIAMSLNSTIRNMPIPGSKNIGDYKFYLENWRVDNCGW